MRPDSSNLAPNTANMSNQPKLRVLIIAEACNPEWVSVPLEGWSHAIALMQQIDGHLVTQIRNQAAIERAGLVLGRDFSVIDSETVASPIYKLASWMRGSAGKGWTLLTALFSLTYPYFEWLLWREFGAAIRAHDFDVVYRITPLSPTAPSLLAKRCARAGVAFVLGPLNGGVPWPRDFDRARRQENEWLSYLRGAYKLLPGYRATRTFATAIIVGSRDTLALENRRYHQKCFYIPENGIDPERFTLRRTRHAQQPLEVVFVGRLVPYKGADMLLEASSALIHDGHVRVTIIGDGPQRTQLESMIDTLGITAGVQMKGWISHANLQQTLTEMDLFAFPSIREFGGAVVLEAMALGLVPAVVNYGGPGELVTPESGFLIEMGTRDQIVNRYRDLLRQLVNDSEQIERRSNIAFKRARTLFSWEFKASQVCRVLSWAAARAPRPVFHCPLTEDDARPEEFSSCK